jgi:MFS family permease
VRGTVKGMPTAAERYAHRATAIAFFVTGAVFASFAARLPALQERLDLSAGQLSLAFLALNAGAVAGLPSGGALVTRRGSRSSLRLGFAIYPPALVGVALAPGLGWLCLVLAAMAAANSVVDVAMNVQGVELERRRARPLLSGLHAAHSIGVVAGAAGGLAAAAAGVPLLAHFSLAAAFGTLWALAATGAMVADRPGETARTAARPDRRLVLLGLLAFCAFLCEGGANDWSAVHLRAEHAASEVLAAAAFFAFSLALAAGRLAGDRIVSRYGSRRAVAVAGLVAAVGLGLAISGAATGATLAGWAVFGAGLSLIVPTVIGAAPRTTPIAAPVAIAGVTTLGYLGSFAGPPLVGGLAELAGLSVALGVLVAAAATIALLAPRALPS